MTTSLPPTVLSFDTLRDANCTRLPQFKNGLGQPAHSEPDGSDWTPAQWLQALFGEVGEFARVRLQYEAGEISREDYVREANKELADVQCYLDILARRALDVVATPKGRDPAHSLMALLADLGEYANWRKKYERGDIDTSAFVRASYDKLSGVAAQLPLLHTPARSTQTVSYADPSGVNLGQATANKFNEVSRRINVPVYIQDNRVSYEPVKA